MVPFPMGDYFCSDQCALCICNITRLSLTVSLFFLLVFVFSIINLIKKKRLMFKNMQILIIWHIKLRSVEMITIVCLVSTVCAERGPSLTSTENKRSRRISPKHHLFTMQDKHVFWSLCQYKKRSVLFSRCFCLLEKHTKFAVFPKITEVWLQNASQS